MFIHHSTFHHCVKILENFDIIINIIKEGFVWSHVSKAFCLWSKNSFASGLVGSLHVVLRTWSGENCSSCSDQQLKRKGFKSHHFKGMSQVTWLYLLDPTTQRLHHFLIASSVGNEALTHEHLTLSKPWQPVKGWSKFL